MAILRAAFGLFVLLGLTATAASGERPPPIIDMHLHALPLDAVGPAMPMCVGPARLPRWDQRETYADHMARFFAGREDCIAKLPTAHSQEALMEESLAVLERRNIFAVTSGPLPLVEAWRAAAPERVLPALMLALEMMGPPPSVDEIRALHGEGRLAVLGEVVTQYEGIAPDDERLAPYWAMAEELDIPVAIHVGTGPPGAAYLDTPGYRGRLHSALTMEEVLVRHPRLRVYLMHAGFPMLEDVLTLMYAHPQVHVDVGAIAFGAPRAMFHRYLQALFEAGVGDRVMFGSDQMLWPGLIEQAIRSIEDAPFLSEAQKRDVLYHNAARFLRLSEAEIASHHGQAAP